MAETHAFLECDCPNGLAGRVCALLNAAECHFPVDHGARVKQACGKLREDHHDPVQRELESFVPDEIRPAPRVSKTIAEMTQEALGEVPAGHKVAVVAQVVRRDGEIVVKGAINYRLGSGWTFVAYTEHNLKPKGLVAGAELRWSK